MATRGGQPGNRNAAKAREWADAIRWALAHHEDDTVKRGQALRRIAARVVEKALEGDPQSIAEIGNRLDGKPAQAVELDGELTLPAALQVEFIRAKGVA